MDFFATRFVRAIVETQEITPDTPPQALEAFREASAWVLLGEPGAGKSAAFAAEAEASGGICISIAEFLIDTLDADWQGKPLFLDGLDETRAGTGDSNTLLQLSAKLRRLGKPRFRIACRAADWYGATDSESIRKASPDGQWQTLLLEPLKSTDIHDILRLNHQIPDPDNFIQKAVELHLDGLLDNPQTLELLAKSIRDGQWPDSRLKTFELACEKLVGEDSKPHRQKLAASPVPNENLLSAAGQLCAALLLADKTGLALDRNQADERFPDLEIFSPPDLAIARLCVRRKLFRPASGVERFQPCHRSIAEFLAARWLGRQIDQQSLPLGRLLNLMQGHDGRTIAGLRGLYGWLALHCQTARLQLIKSDPLTVIVYGDVKPMSPADKRQLLAGLRQETETNIVFDRNIRSRTSFGNLADLALVVDFQNWLKSPERDDGSQAFLAIVLDVLTESEPLPELAEALKSVAMDNSYWGRIREDALLAWLKSTPSPSEALALLDAINDRCLADPDDQLIGLLLQHLYPAHIPPENLLRYLHPRKRQDLIGNHSGFWSRHLPDIAPTAHLPVLLDQFTMENVLPMAIVDDFDLRRMLGSLLSRGIEFHGDTATDARLFAWLGIGADEHGSIQREAGSQERIATWLKQRPARYKSLLSYSLGLCRENSDFHNCLFRQRQYLPTDASPADLGLWHLGQVSLETDQTLAQYHLNQAFYALMWKQKNQGLKLEMFEHWAEQNPKRKPWLDALLSWEIHEWRQDEAKHKKQRKQQNQAIRKSRTVELSKQLNSIRTGTAHPSLMHELAGVWLNRFSDTQGDTSQARFELYCENADEVLAAAKAGFFISPLRGDLPQVPEIIKLRTQQHEHFVRTSCLIGMDLRWQEAPVLLLALSDEQLQKMAAFWLTYDIGQVPAWFRFLVRERPLLLADVYVDYVVAMLKARQEGIAGLHSLAKDPEFEHLARLALPRLLAAFPIKANNRQLYSLESLLKAALNRAVPLPDLIEKKLALKSMDSPQKVCWLTTGMLLDAEHYEQRLWDYIGKSWIRANTLAWFISDRFSQWGEYEYPLSPYSIGRLIELLTPHAELGRASGFVNAAAQRGDQIRNLITRLSSLANNEAAIEIERLKKLPTLQKLKWNLDSALNELRLKQRENSFTFPSLTGVVNVIANREPASNADLTALVLDHLDDFAKLLRSDNSDLFRQFWSEGTNNVPKPENSCRDALLAQLRLRLKPFNIDCDPEVDQFNDKRADIRLSFRNEFVLPIEIKRQSNDSLWTALRQQLIDQYTRSPKTANHGIYLVLWFNSKDTYKANDGGSKPTTPSELKTRLEAQLTSEERKRVHVRVLDVSWPGTAG
ncbi:NACHT domain-containing NTPase [Azovibrio restrictus]|uniref:NACHT domain-containing protein n=1 Tax=Azovibrio restrictus TaxID=146938 RepID=UPI0026F061B0|nr:hypothetical protein [Azovibrio restrictus]MDD3484142.1 hypothetical protein [Azovibrio restrictus]